MQTVPLAHSKCTSDLETDSLSGDTTPWPGSAAPHLLCRTGLGYIMRTEEILEALDLRDVSSVYSCGFHVSRAEKEG